MGKLLYSDFAHDLRNVALSFLLTPGKKAITHLLSQANIIESFPTGSMLAAWLLHFSNVEKEHPPFNHLERHPTLPIRVFDFQTETGYRALHPTSKPWDGHPFFYAPNLAQAQATLIHLSRHHALCPSLCGITGADKFCPRHGVGANTCACKEGEDPRMHNERFARALDSIDIPADCAFLLEDGRSHKEKTIIHMDGKKCMGFEWSTKSVAKSPGQTALPSNAEALIRTYLLSGNARIVRKASLPYRVTR